MADRLNPLTIIMAAQNKNPSNTFKQTVKMDETFEQTISQFLSLADFVCCEVVIGMRSTPDGQMIWATNGIKMREKLLTEGLRFDESDDFFDETGIKDENIFKHNDEHLVVECVLKDDNVVDDDVFGKSGLRERNIVEDDKFFEGAELGDQNRLEDDAEDFTKEITSKTDNVSEGCGGNDFESSQLKEEDMFAIGPPCLTLIRPAGGPPPKRPYVCLKL